MPETINFLQSALQFGKQWMGSFAMIGLLFLLLLLLLRYLLFLGSHQRWQALVVWQALMAMDQGYDPQI